MWCYNISEAGMMVVRGSALMKLFGGVVQYNHKFTIVCDGEVVGKLG